MKKFTAILLSLVLAVTMYASVFADSNTSVNVTIDSSQISVAVPTTLAITAKVDGGAALVAESYKIKNNSLIPIKVDTIAVTLNDDEKWAFKSSAIEANTAPTNTGINDIYFSLNDQVLKVQTATAPTDLTKWNISANADLVIPLVCSTSRLNQTEGETGLITITYVISAGAH